METQEILTAEVGTKEPEKKTLEPAIVKIVHIQIEPIEKAKAIKAVFMVKHPDREDTIRISSAQWIDGKKVVTIGTWVNEDDDGKLQKGSAIARLIEKLEVKNLQETIGKDIETVYDDDEYLCFKVY